MEPAPPRPLAAAAAHTLWQRLQGWADELGFSQIGVADIDLRHAEAGLLAWLEQGWHGSMAYMARHGLKRARPAELVPGTISVITARMDYLPPGAAADWRAREWARLRDPQRAVVSLYARGRDYHKVLRQRLQALAERLQSAWVELQPDAPPPACRVFTDSAPVLEVELAARSGLGWRGKHTLLLSRQAGSMFFLGEIYLDRWLPRTPAQPPHCGQCRACLDVCPTGAIVAPYRLDARRCIAYLTIEHEGPIPQELRPLMGNRIYGCDDCQLVCPWNKFAQRSRLADFVPRSPWDDATLLHLWGWQAADFERHTQGSAIRRIGYVRWRRNLAVALGNARRAAHAAGVSARAQAIEAALRDALQHGADPPLVREHILWALG